MDPSSSSTVPDSHASGAAGREPGLVLLALAMITMAALLAPTLTAGPLALDEHVSYWMLDSDQPATVWTRCLDYGAVPPLGSLLQQWSLAIFGKHEWALRLPSILAAWLALPVVYKLGQHLAGGTCGGVAACLLAMHPDLLDEVRIGRCYGLVVLLAALMILATVRWKEQLDDGYRSAWWGGAAVALLWTHYTAVLLVAATGAFLAWEVLRSRQRGRALARFVVVAIGAGICLSPLLAPIERLREWGPYLNMQAPESSIWQIVSPFWWLGLPLGVAVTAGASRFVRRETAAQRGVPSAFCENGWLLLACSLVPVAVIALGAVGDLSSLSSPRYRVAYVPAGAVWVAWVLCRSGSARIAITGVGVLLLAIWCLQPLRPWQLGRLGSPTDQEWAEIGRVISEQSQPGDPLLVQSGLVESSLVGAFVEDPLFLEYVSCRVSRFTVESSHPRWGLPYFWDDSLQRAFRDRLQSSTAPRLWIASATDTDLNRESLAGARQIAQQAGYRIVQERVSANAVLLQMSR